LHGGAIAILGSTGSIGQQTLSVAKSLGIPVAALAAKSNVSVIEAQARAFLPKMAVLEDEQAAAKLKIALADLPIQVSGGKEAVLEAAAESKAHTVVAAMVGMAGLAPVMAAISAGKDMALANKEVLVCAGRLMTEAARENNVRLLPVDSEHSAIFQCMSALADGDKPEKLILTASGGPFFGKKRWELENVTPKEALAHPNWSMGPKITIDSATMMNKGLELIEAMWLFDMPEDKIDIVIHRESIVHSLIQTTDGSVLAQMGLPDMRGPIQYALTAPRRVPSDLPRLDLTKIGVLHFAPPDEEAFPALSLARKAAREGGAAPVVLNGANEVAVARFLAGEIRFLEIAERVGRAMEKFSHMPADTLADIFAIDAASRDFTNQQ
jgi:1-deoxy-D-xylulose-5-phosphate reductoisomerase